MSDVLTKCSVCGAMLDEEDLFCSNCGTEAPAAGTAQCPSDSESAESSAADPVKLPPAPPVTQVTTFNFTCRGCGASMSYDASAKALRCPFCGSTQLDKQADAKEIAPDTVIAFVISRGQAVATMREWLGRGFWRPGDLAEQAAVVAMTPVYVPYWVFEAETHTFWTADSSVVPPTASGDWHPVGGSHEGQYADLLVGASGALAAAETKAICPFDLSAAVLPEKVDLQNITFERFSVPRKYARPLARQGLEAL